MKKVGIYARVSTPDQSTEMQINDLKRYCEQRGFQIYRIYEDLGISGVKESRPSLDELIKDARKKRFEICLVWKFDRFFRSCAHMLSALQEFRDLGIDFISYSEGIDTSTSIGKMVFTFLSAVAEFERSLIRERVQAGIDTARRNGVKLGRPKVTFDLDRAIELRETGQSFNQISKKLGVSIGTLFRGLKDMEERSKNLPKNREVSLNFKNLPEAISKTIDFGKPEKDNN